MTSLRNVGMKRGRALWLAAAIVLGGTGCSLEGLLNSDQVPANLTDPAITKTAKGALAVYNGVLTTFRVALGGSDQSGGNVITPNVVTQSGLLTDELTDQGNHNFIVPDQRDISTAGIVSFDPTNGSTYIHTPDTVTFTNLQKVRGQAMQAIGLLTDYADPAQPELVAHAYAIEGYAEVLLAELYCSGIPLSTLDYNGDYTLKPGSSTAQVFTHAAALFDTALGMAGDSTRFLYLAAIGKGRALLGTGDFTGAAAAVAAVPDAYQYGVTYTAGNGFRNFGYKYAPWPSTVGNGEGLNGLDYVGSQDPRVPLITDGLLTGSTTDSVYRPGPPLYSTDGTSPIILASGVEARLIQAEAALQGGDPSWLTTLNALRTDGTYDLTATSPPDTLWHAGTGGVAGLAPLSDPGTAAGRVDLLFRERAFWLFLTGHRQGDLRRLIQHYGRTQDQVYPTGIYAPAADVYGSDVNLPIPANERVLNPLFTGCGPRDT